MEKLTGAKDSNFSHPHNRGKGAAIRTAIEHATGDVLLIKMPISNMIRRLPTVAQANP